MPKLNSYYFKITSVFYMLWVFAFVFTGMYANRLDSLNLTSLIDKEIPLIPEFVWFYLLCFIFPFIRNLNHNVFNKLIPSRAGESIAVTLAFINNNTR